MKDSSKLRMTRSFPPVRFEAFAEECPHRFLDSKGIPNCKYHDSSIGFCEVENCPKWEEKKGIQANGGNHHV